jgi:hypothetical protein
MRRAAILFALMACTQAQAWAGESCIDQARKVLSEKHQESISKVSCLAGGANIWLKTGYLVRIEGGTQTTIRIFQLDKNELPQIEILAIAQPNTGKPTLIALVESR